MKLLNVKHRSSLNLMTYKCIDMCMYVCIMYVCIYVCMYVRMYVHTYVCMYVRMYVCMYVRTYVYVHTHTHTHTYTHIFISSISVTITDVGGHDPPFISVSCCSLNRSNVITITPSTDVIAQPVSLPSFNLLTSAVIFAR